MSDEKSKTGFISGPFGELDTTLWNSQAVAVERSDLEDIKDAPDPIAISPNIFHNTIKPAFSEFGKDLGTFTNLFDAFLKAQEKIIRQEKDAERVGGANWHEIRNTQKEEPEPDPANVDAHLKDFSVKDLLTELEKRLDPNPDFSNIRSADVASRMLENHRKRRKDLMAYLQELVPDLDVETKEGMTRAKQRWLEEEKKRWVATAKNKKKGTFTDEIMFKKTKLSRPLRALASELKQGVLPLERAATETDEQVLQLFLTSCYWLFDLVEFTQALADDLNEDAEEDYAKKPEQKKEQEGSPRPDWNAIYDVARNFAMNKTSTNFLRLFSFLSVPGVRAILEPALFGSFSEANWKAWTDLANINVQRSLPSKNLTHPGYALSISASLLVRTVSALFASTRNALARETMDYSARALAQWFTDGLMEPVERMINANIDDAEEDVYADPEDEEEERKYRRERTNLSDKKAADANVGSNRAVAEAEAEAEAEGEIDDDDAEEQEQDEEENYETEEAMPRMPKRVVRASEAELHLGDQGKWWRKYMAPLAERWGAMGLLDASGVPRPHACFVDAARLSTLPEEVSTKVRTLSGTCARLPPANARPQLNMLIAALFFLAERVARAPKPENWAPLLHTLAHMSDREQDWARELTEGTRNFLYHTFFRDEHVRKMWEEDVLEHVPLGRDQPVLVGVISMLARVLDAARARNAKRAGETVGRLREWLRARKVVEVLQAMEARRRAMLQRDPQWKPNPVGVWLDQNGRPTGASPHRLYLKPLPPLPPARRSPAPAPARRSPAPAPARANSQTMDQNAAKKMMEGFVQPDWDAKEKIARVSIDKGWHDAFPSTVKPASDRQLALALAKKDHRAWWKDNMRPLAARWGATDLRFPVALPAQCLSGESKETLKLCPEPDQLPGLRALTDLLFVRAEQLAAATNVAEARPLWIDMLKRVRALPEGQQWNAELRESTRRFLTHSFFHDKRVRELWTKVVRFVDNEKGDRPPLLTLCAVLARMLSCLRASGDNARVALHELSSGVKTWLEQRVGATLAREPRAAPRAVPKGVPNVVPKLSPKAVVKAEAEPGRLPLTGANKAANFIRYFDLPSLVKQEPHETANKAANAIRYFELPSLGQQARQEDSQADDAEETESDQETESEPERE
jgi:hypothetical protein